MASLFTPAQRAALERAAAECHACAELIGTLTTMGFDVSLKQAENEMVQKAITTALTMDTAYGSRTEPEPDVRPEPDTDRGGGTRPAKRTARKTAGK